MFSFRYTYNISPLLVLLLLALLLLSPVNTISTTTCTATTSTIATTTTTTSGLSHSFFLRFHLIALLSRLFTPLQTERASSHFPPHTIPCLPSHSTTVHTYSLTLFTGNATEKESLSIRPRRTCVLCLKVLLLLLLLFFLFFACSPKMYERLLSTFMYVAFYMFLYILFYSLQQQHHHHTIYLYLLTQDA